ncbi:polysaccharide deacetylase family protein [Brachybacterium sp. YJGR34]|uniref:polysaccharide deacetylase family protein n=1 Tax=Brachybacterium sp. YJGR34 TaxID=2059911 RepID=UPI000E0CB3C2|nr:polysaccharide deacetylase family protein [Brachybacterium sp. YJGR34]
MTATDYGLATPVGDDLISLGDNAISANAERTAELFDLLRFARPRATTETDLNRITAPGATNLPAPYPSGYTNVPEGNTTASILLNARGEGEGWGGRFLFQIGDNPKLWWQTSLNTNELGEWQPVPGPGGARGTLPEGTDVDTMRGPQWAGAWDIPGAAVAGSMTGTLPPGLTSWAPGQWVNYGAAGGNTNLSSQMYMPYTQVGARAPMVLFRTIDRYAQTGAAAWSPWVNLAGGSSGPSDLPVNALALGSRDMRMQLYLDAYPLATTGDKGVVCFRYDHGLTNFADVLWPLHQQYNLSAYIAMNSRNWDLAENNGATQADARAWIASGLVEFGNHTATHKDSTGIADIWDNIVNGRIELEDQLNTTVHGFTVPGVTEHSKFDGFGVGYASGYSNSYGGSLILTHHAIASGVIGDFYRPLDGRIRQGGRHIGWESKTFAETKAAIDEAIETKTALTLMQHPRTMGITGYWTPELADQVLAYVREQIDAGNLADLSYYQSHHATL